MRTYKNEREQEAKPGPLSLFESTRSNLRHRDQAIPANNVDLFGSPDALPTAGVSNLPCAGSPARSRWGDASFCSRSSHAPHGKARFPVHHNIVPALGVLWIVMRKFFYGPRRRLLSVLGKNYLFWQGRFSDVFNQDSESKCRRYNRRAGGRPSHRSSCPI